MIFAITRLALSITMLFALLLGVLRLPSIGKEAGAAAFFTPPSNCGIPCWQAFQPGVTGRENAIALLGRLKWLPVSDCLSTSFDTCSGFFWVNNAHPEYHAYVYLGSDQVYQIALSNPGLTLGDVWLTFGRPDFGVPDTRYRASLGNGGITYTAMWFGSDGINTQVQLLCPANFSGLLQAPVSTLILWHRDATPTQDASRDALPDLRRAFRAVCR